MLPEGGRRYAPAVSSSLLFNLIRSYIIRVRNRTQEKAMSVQVHNFPPWSPPALLCLPRRTEEQKEAARRLEERRTEVRRLFNAARDEKQQFEIHIFRAVYKDHQEMLDQLLHFLYHVEDCPEKVLQYIRDLLLPPKQQEAA
jgi:hypothetical protein